MFACRACAPAAVAPTHSRARRSPPTARRRHRLAVCADAGGGGSSGRHAGPAVCLHHAGSKRRQLRREPDESRRHGAAAVAAGVCALPLPLPLPPLLVRLCRGHLQVWQRKERGECCPGAGACTRGRPAAAVTPAARARSSPYLSSFFPCCSMPMVALNPYHLDYVEWRALFYWSV